jgi:hypothetical protein
LFGAPDDYISNDDVLRLLLGAAVDYSGYLMPRYDVDGSPVPMTRQSFVLDHTELLVDDYDVCVGFFIPDMGRESDDKINTVCASIEVWRVHEDIHRENDTIEATGIQAIDQSNEILRRIGRGRIICNAWLPRCKRRSIVII